MPPRRLRFILPMRAPKYFQNILVGVSALLFAGSRLSTGHDQDGPVLASAVSFVRGTPGFAGSNAASRATGVAAGVAGVATAAVRALGGAVRPLSRPDALEGAFRSYFAYRASHPNEVRKPFLYFVDYGLPSTTPRGYVFDMDSLRVVDGPFTVAHGRGSSRGKTGVPTRFSNAWGSNATSLGLYVARAVYDFHGKSGGRPYSSLGLRLDGVSRGFNDNALARHVVAHGAPYVTPGGAGRSEGCPAMEPTRARELLPKLADGGMVFLFAPDQEWLARDPWMTASAD